VILLLAILFCLAFGVWFAQASWDRLKTDVKRAKKVFKGE